MKRFIIIAFLICPLNAFDYDKDWVGNFNYNRNSAVNYATQWCNDFNPQYKDKYFRTDRDCAHFVSQCLIAGGLNLIDPCNQGRDGLVGDPPRYRSVRYLINFLQGIAEETTDPSCVRIGDIVVFYNSRGTPSHVGIVTGKDSNNFIKFSAHTNNRCNARIRLKPQVRVYRILDYYKFYSEYRGGYYYRILGRWIGPVQDEELTAVGYNPSAYEEFAGFNSFDVRGLPRRSQIKRAYLRLVLFQTGTFDPLHFNIKFVGYESPPNADSIVNPPYNLTDQIFEGTSDGAYKYYTLPPELYGNIIYASSNQRPFVLGYSRYSGCNTMRYFYDYTFDPDVDATLLVFVDTCSSLPRPDKENLPASFENEKIYPVKIQLNLKTNIMKISYELFVDTHLDIYVLSADGRKIKNIFSGYKPSGKYEILWDLKDEQKREIPKGVYFLVIKIGDSIKSEKFVKCCD
jgi:hypothetical protein